VPSAPLVEHDTALCFDLRRVDSRCRQPLLQYVEACLDGRRVSRRHRQLVDRFVVARVRIDVGAKARTEAAQYSNQLVFRELLGAVEQHVLEKVRTAALVLGLERCASIDRQPHLDTRARIVVLSDEVPQAVVERARDDRRVDLERQECTLIRLNNLGSGTPLGATLLGATLLGATLLGARREDLIGGRCCVGRAGTRDCGQCSNDGDAQEAGTNGATRHTKHAGRLRPRWPRCGNVKVHRFAVPVSTSAC
jgi:hypothetical protein